MKLIWRIVGARIVLRAPTTLVCQFGPGIALAAEGLLTWCKAFGISMRRDDIVRDKSPIHASTRIWHLIERTPDELGLASATLVGEFAI
ncbi:hypothetical protein N7522_001327 [Penicillium canescens]|uniref:Uncharacterized protein n=1 Tax=Penicillium canescens TaxID=5083 RepID=A0AAD6IN89_PENCN|nr:uncharacterized protein N7446_008399 [Penicillium canescens]KAJ6019260.1 hypothetical protein N7522_001327 [Penicillium canescens]KAJ6033311.1 hypothetical protein N7444_011082 [Penicillium canescens]KAJ6057500.1 hypothetical protein N7460_000774 [Penicillium canescens]KAJ6058816.1 hypothetical protein N7446_008399 [Penicillium canescens]